MPTVAYCEHGPGCPEHTIRADYPETPELAELREVYATQGLEAVGVLATSGNSTTANGAIATPPASATPLSR